MGAALALRFFSAVQYLRDSSGEVSTVCLMIRFEGFGFLETRFTIRITPMSSKQSKIVPTRGNGVSLRGCDIMALFHKQSASPSPCYRDGIPDQDYFPYRTAQYQGHFSIKHYISNS